MGPVEVGISTDSVSLIIIPFSYVVDGIELYMDLTRDVTAS